MNPKFQNLNYKKIAIICGVMFVFGILFAYVIFPPILKTILKMQVVLKPGTQMRDMYDALPFPLIFKVYLWHCHNPDEVMKGAKPKLEERGPYVFEEWKVKVDQVEDVEKDTIEFVAKNTFIFKPELSNGLTGNEEITMLHPLIAGIVFSINRDRAPMLPLINKALKALFHEPKTLFWTGKAMDMMFHGTDIDCSSSDFNAKATCSVFEGGEVKTVTPKEGEDDMYIFSLLGASNGSAAGKFKTFRGIKNIKDLGRVIEFNDEPELDVWDGDECNELRGTESSIFPPFGKKEDGIWAFEAAICRSMLARYERKSKYSGLPTLHYHLDLGDIPNDESLHCYCDGDDCPLKGTMDLFACTGSPIIASMPHFFNGDPSLLENIESGLNPDKDLHSIYINFEIRSGTPLSAAKRIQFNYELMPLEDIDFLTELPTLVMPFVWVEEGVNLNKTYVNMLKYQLFLALKFKAVFKYLCLVVGSLGCIGASIMQYKKQNAESLGITKIPATTTTAVPKSLSSAAKPATVNNLSERREERTGSGSDISYGSNSSATGPPKY